MSDAHAAVLALVDGDGLAHGALGGSGWYFAGGYQSIAFGSGTSLLDSVAGILDRVPPELQKYVDEYAAEYVGSHGVPGYELSATMHMLTLEAGYQWIAFDRLIVRWSLGFAGTVAADVTIAPEVKGYSEDDKLADVARDAEERLHDVLTTYGFLPQIGFGVGYRFEGHEVVE